MNRQLLPEQTRSWLKSIASQALREADYEQRRRRFAKTLKRLQRQRRNILH